MYTVLYLSLFSPRFPIVFCFFIAGIKCFQVVIHLIADWLSFMDKSHYIRIFWTGDVQKVDNTLSAYWLNANHVLVENNSNQQRRCHLCLDKKTTCVRVDKNSNAGNITCNVKPPPVIMLLKCHNKVTRGQLSKISEIWLLFYCVLIIIQPVFKESSASVDLLSLNSVIFRMIWVLSCIKYRHQDQDQVLNRVFLCSIPALADYFLKRNVF